MRYKCGNLLQVGGFYLTNCIIFCNKGESRQCFGYIRRLLLMSTQGIRCEQDSWCLS